MRPTCERALAASEHNRANLAVSVEVQERLIEFPNQGRAESIQRLGSVESDLSDARRRYAGQYVLVVLARRGHGSQEQA